MAGVELMESRQKALLLARRPPATVRPVLWWAVLGAIFLVELVYVFARYLADLPENIPAGPTDVPWWMAFNIHAQEVIFLAVLVVVSVVLVIRPLVRRQPIPFDGLFLGAFLSLMWQNYGTNWFGYWSTYNSVVVNLGNWYRSVTFWSATPAEGLAEAPLWDLGFFGLWLAFTVWLCFVMRRVHHRWPQLSNFQLFLALFAFTMCLDFAAEVLWMRGGLYNYAGAPDGWYLLFSGHYYQFPLYEVPLAGLMFAAPAALRYYKNDLGRTLVERKIDDLKIRQRGKQWIRFLSLVGFLNLLLLVYNLSMTIPVIHGAGEWPVDIQKRSYFTQGVCGIDTGRACRGHGVPLPLPGSAYMNQDGGLSHPDGWVPPILKVPFAP